MKTAHGVAPTRCISNGPGPSKQELMHRSHILRCVLGTAAALTLAGCGMGVMNDPGQIAPPAASEPPMSGSVYGGHAPLVGAHVYVLTPSTTANAGLATSLTNSNGVTTNSYNLTLDSSGGPGNGMYYVTTDQYGVFNLTGSYSCTANQPVYLAATGGAPSYAGAGPNTFSVSSIVVSNVAGQSAGGGTATYTFNTPKPELFYVGESVTFANTNITANNGLNPGYFNSGTYTVSGTNLTTSSFQITFNADYGGNPGATTPYFPAGTTNQTNATVTGTPVNNPAVVNLTALGPCPSSGNFSTAGNGALSYIFMNEVSTTATTFAMAGFGSDGFHIGANQGGSLNSGALNSSLKGYVTGSVLQAMNNAYLLYDITGGNLGTAFDGEGHIARATTPVGNGTVPQTKIDTVANILAACVDSANTTASPSTACSTLFANATSDGSSTGTKPADIAAAAFNIAHYPVGTNNANFVTNLYNIPTGNVPFLPQLTSAPADYTIALQFSVGSTAGGTNLISNPQMISIDGEPYAGTESGTSQPANAVWVGNYSGPPLKLFGTGTPDYATNTALVAAGEKETRAIAFDGSSNPWILNENSGTTTHYTNTGTALLAVPAAPNGLSLFNNGTSVALDSSSNVYIDNEDLIQKVSSTGTNITPGGAYWSSNNANIGGTTATSNFTNTVYLDSTGLVYTIASASLSAGAGKLCVANAATAVCNQLVSGFTVGTGSNALQFSALDGSNNFWSTNYNSNNIVKYNYVSSPTAILGTYTGGGLNSPSATAVDGSGNIWVANAGGILTGSTSVNSLSEFTPSGTALSPTTGFGAQGLPASTNSADLVIDRAGNIWVVYSGLNYVYEYIGLATPAVTPTQFATFNGFLGKRPL